jgi:putative DNA primase/helicase
MNMRQFHAKANSKWYDILTTLGVREEFLTGKHTPCPICGGKDRFRFDDKDGLGTWFCNQCQPQAGDGIKLIQKVFGINFIEALERIDKVIDDGAKKRQINFNTIDPKIVLNKVWQSGLPLKPQDPVLKYLSSRKLHLRPNNVRYCEQCYHSELKTGIPALIAKITNIENKPVSIQRIYLTLEGKKRTDIQDIKKIMPGTESLQGSAVRLFSPTDHGFDRNTLGIAEGIETAIAATTSFNIATWACLSSTLMKTWAVPKEYSFIAQNARTNIVIFGDNDKNFCGQEAAYTLAKILHKQEYPVTVKIPPEPGQDWLDCL